LSSNFLTEKKFYIFCRNRSYANGHRLKINIGNIYFRKKEYTKALKYYRMALDQVPKVRKRKLFF